MFCPVLGTGQAHCGRNAPPNIWINEWNPVIPTWHVSAASEKNPERTGKMRSLHDFTKWMRWARQHYWSWLSFCLESPLRQNIKVSCYHILNFISFKLSLLIWSTSICCKKVGNILARATNLKICWPQPITKLTLEYNWHAPLVLTLVK